MIEVTDGEELEPRLGVWFLVVNQFEWSSQFLTEAAGDLVKHGRGGLDRVEPELAPDLFFGDVRA